MKSTAFASYQVTKQSCVCWFENKPLAFMKTWNCVINKNPEHKQA